MMADDILDSVGFVIGMIIAGVIIVGFGLFLQNGFVVLVGGFFYWRCSYSKNYFYDFGKNITFVKK